MTRRQRGDEERRARGGGEDGRRRLQRAAEELQLSVCGSRIARSPTSVVPAAVRELADVAGESRVAPQRVEPLQCAAGAEREGGGVQRGEGGAEVQLRVEGTQGVDEDARVIGANDHLCGRGDGVLLEETAETTWERRRGATAAPAWRCRSRAPCWPW